MCSAYGSHLIANHLVPKTTQCPHKIDNSKQHKQTNRFRHSHGDGQGGRELHSAVCGVCKHCVAADLSGCLQNKMLEPLHGTPNSTELVSALRRYCLCCADAAYAALMLPMCIELYMAVSCEL